MVVPLLHRLFLDHDIIFYFLEIIEKNKLSFEYFWKYCGKWNKLLQKSKCSIFHKKDLNYFFPGKICRYHIDDHDK